jgi:hypothetical protein
MFDAHIKSVFSIQDAHCISLYGIHCRYENCKLKQNDMKYQDLKR